MTPKCLWTGTHSDRAIQIEVQGTDRLGRPGDMETVSVLPEHEADLRAYVGLARRFGSILLGGILGLTAVSVIAAVLGAAGVWSDTAAVWAIGASVSGIGVLMIVLPLATPETLQAFGVRRSIQIARVSGAVTFVTGLAIAFFG
jgi:hypothetical protein